MTARYNSPREELVPFFPASARRVLDIGCGGGGFGRKILERYPDVEFSGVEPHTVSAEVARLSGYVRVEEGGFPEAARVFPAEAFDAIFFNDVLEHMVDPAAALLATRRLLSPTGRVIASIPNVRHFSVWWPLVRYGDWPYADSGLLDRTHLKFFTRKTIVQLFQQTGWRIETISGINRTRWPESNTDTWKTKWLGRLTLGRSDDFFFVQYVVVARADPDFA
jgi:2-polyprenyl-3-methyl-5-hydroxy-6-metoxy-1,4-benzoquinol methylase